MGLLFLNLSFSVRLLLYKVKMNSLEALKYALHLCVLYFHNSPDFQGICLCLSTLSVTYISLEKKWFFKEWNQTNQVTWAGPWPPYIHVADVRLGLHVGPEQPEWWLSQKLLPVYGMCSSGWAALLASVGKEASSLTETWVARVGRHPGGYHRLRGEGERGRRKGWRTAGGGDQEGGSELDVMWISKKLKLN